jgi:ABC-2 type transport system ATP-binding protein
LEARIELKDVTRDYGQVRGLNGVSLTIGPGVTGLLGPNGAGKSTLIRLVTGHLRPSVGEVLVFGESPFANPRVLARLGCCPDVDRFNDDRTARRFVRDAAYLAGFAYREAGKRAAELLDYVGLGAAADRALGSYSKGMRQRAKIAQALVHDPEIFVLDEPLNGLDPVGRRQVMDLIRGLGRRDRSVLVSSHVLHEVEAVTDQVILIHHGKVLAEGQISEIRALISRHPMQVRIESGSPRAVAARVVAEEAVRGVAFEDSAVTIETRDTDALLKQIESVVLDDGVDVTRLQPADESLDAVFDYLVR